ncbi:MAG: hypothetical protein LBL82_04045 [Oscillospiraceae bacterium]|jgi:hypothetical protein|nr:hypothetical protein [Oscillospiraceae bacterium]
MKFTDFGAEKKSGKAAERTSGGGQAVSKRGKIGRKRQVPLSTFEKVPHRI